MRVVRICPEPGRSCPGRVRGPAPPPGVAGLDLREHGRAAPEPHHCPVGGPGVGHPGGDDRVRHEPRPDRRRRIGHRAGRHSGRSARRAQQSAHERAGGHEAGRSAGRQPAVRGLWWPVGGCPGGGRPADRGRPLPVPAHRTDGRTGQPALPGTAGSGRRPAPVVRLGRAPPGGPAVVGRGRRVRTGHGSLVRRHHRRPAPAARLRRHPGRGPGRWIGTRRTGLCAAATPLGRAHHGGGRRGGVRCRYRRALSTVDTARRGGPGPDRHRSTVDGHRRVHRRPATDQSRADRPGRRQRRHSRLRPGRPDHRRWRRPGILCPSPGHPPAGRQPHGGRGRRRRPRPPLSPLLRCSVGR